jgi:hypothetical protein
MNVRTKVMFPGVKNSQKIRVLVDGFGMYMRVCELPNICTSNHRAAIESAMISLSSSIAAGNQITGFASGVMVYDDKMQNTRVDVQIDLVN